jgi:hypothetical protein
MVLLLMYMFPTVYQSGTLPQNVHPCYFVSNNCYTVVQYCWRAVRVAAKDNQPSTTHKNTLRALLAGNASKAKEELGQSRQSHLFEDN